ncbi:serine/threonine protein kinase [Penicillium brasilianum]|uniref:Serine/threonine protein kinase n=1 Tax=Penicillium brasilianum TaxID=104259 RepID=A0A1S9RNM2_PENBI|nr:serine/threonine protein kinase [Penicillium brasilianum]
MRSLLPSSPVINDPGICVGTLSLWDSTTHETSRPLEVYINEEVFIGRDAKRCSFHLTNPYISNKHIRIYTILFDQDNLEDVPPLIYAEDLSMNGTFWNGYPMGKGKGSSLLSDGDILRVAGDTHIRFKSADPDTENKFTQLQQLEMRSFQKSYVITQRVLGSGAYGRVHMAFNVNTGRQFACKIVDLQAAKSEFRAQARAREGLGEEMKSKFFEKRYGPLESTSMTGKSSTLERFIVGKVAMQQRESLLLAQLSHPNIIAAEKVIRSSNTIYIFTELVTCGDLFSYVRNKGPLEETTVALIIRQVLLALEYLHDQNIVHRDVKPDNILMTCHEVGGRVVLADFGCARLVNQPSQRMSSVVGTLDYCAPELKHNNAKGYTKAVDMWSLGCVTAVLLMGDTPFENELRSTASDLVNLDLDMRALDITSRPRNFVRRLLVQDEGQRMNVKGALRHDWFTNPTQAEWFNDMYNRSIQSWKPRSSTEPVIVELASLKSVPANNRLPSTSAVTFSPKEGARFADVDHISESSWENILPTCTEPLISPTISNSAPKKSSRRSPLISLDQNSANKPKNPQHSPCLTSPDPDVKFISQVKREQLDTPNVESHILYVSSHEDPSDQRAGEKKQLAPKEATKAKFTVNTNSGMRNFFIPSRTAASSCIHPSLPAFPQRPPKEESDLADQVFEEVRNPITGKRKRLIYGRDMESLSQML